MIIRRLRADSSSDFPATLETVWVLSGDWDLAPAEECYNPLDKKVGFHSVCFSIIIMSSHNQSYLFRFRSDITCTHSHMVAASSKREAMTKQSFEV